MDDYRPTRRSRIRRLAKRARYDRATVHAILDEALFCQLAVVIDGHAAVVPTAHWRDGERIYVHGARASRVLRAATRSEVCISVSLIDGLVLARSGFHHSFNYRSVVVYGVAEPIEGTAKLVALERFVDKIAPGRWAELRPVTAAEIDATRVLAVPLIEVSAKVRAGQPVDDEADYALPVWAGVVPLKLEAGPPQADPRLGAGVPLPIYLGRE